MSGTLKRLKWCMNNNEIRFPTGSVITDNTFRRWLVCGHLADGCCVLLGEGGEVTNYWKPEQSSDKEVRVIIP